MIGPAGFGAAPKKDAAGDGEIDGRTNRERRFRSGDVIRFADETYEVVYNYGTSGLVKYFPMDSGETFSFLWTFEGEDCVLITPAEE